MADASLVAPAYTFLKHPGTQVSTEVVELLTVEEIAEKLKEKKRLLAEANDQLASLKV
jgi:hypothetical protein